MKKTVKTVAVAAAALAGMATMSMAAGSDTGVEAGFHRLGTDLTTILNGAGGFVILIASVILGGIVLAVTGRWAQVGIAVGVALFLGYGVQTLTSLGSVTASTDLLEASAAETITLEEAYI